MHESIYVYTSVVVIYTCCESWCLRDNIVMLQYGSLLPEQVYIHKCVYIQYILYVCIILYH